MGLYQGDKPLAIAGKSAYQQAVEGGYTGTQDEFSKLLAILPTESKQIKWDNAVASHNADTSAHSDIREAVSEAGKAFVITGTLASDELGGYTVSGVTVTEAEIQAAIAAGKAVVAKLTDGEDGDLYELPLVRYSETQYQFGGNLRSSSLFFAILYTESGIEFEVSTFYAADADSVAILSDKVNNYDQIFVPHVNDPIIHVTADDKTSWDGKAAKALSFTVTLTAAGWSGNAQIVSNSNFAASGYAYTVCPASGSYEAYANAIIYADDVTTEGKMTFHCSEKPTANLTVNILRVEVAA